MEGPRWISTLSEAGGSIAAGRGLGKAEPARATLVPPGEDLGPGSGSTLKT